MIRVRQSDSRQKGAVSLFVVIFTALLITIITVSFIQLMVRDQQQATYSDLSESAYDSAMAGVEDAKRALLMSLDCGDDDSTPTCSVVSDAISDGECNTLSRIFLGNGDLPETIIQQDSVNDSRLDQAYTCVKITPDTPDYIGTIESPETATLIPLRGVGDFNTIVIRWHQVEGGGPVDRDGGGNFPVSGGWPANRPAVLRTQLINGSGSFSLSDFDSADRSSTLFLYPSPTVNSLEFALDGRRSGLTTPQAVGCEAIVLSGEYACEAVITLDSAISAGQQGAFLNLSAFYGATDYQIELRNDSSRVDFDGVQPEVDSTGRANDLFRRVVSRVELNNTFRYPVAAIETSGNLCKNFTVTNEDSGYRDNCTP